MMRGVASTHGEAPSSVQILDEALEAAVRLSHRYIPARQLPDKAVSLLDTACARVAISQHAVPAGGRGLPQAHRGARDRAGDHRPRDARSASTPPSARSVARTQLEQSERDGSRSSRSAGRRRRTLVDQILGIAREAARRTGTVDGAGGRAGRRQACATPSARSCSRELRELQAQACARCRARRR